MQSWLALLRGINVGGKNVLKMADLKGDFESLGCKKVRTYIQSGNVAFDSAMKNKKALSTRITDRLKKQRNLEPHVFLMRDLEFLNAIESNPFPHAIADPKSLHFLFLDKPAKFPNYKLLDKAKSATEEYRLTDRVFYLHAPDGIGRSKLAAGAENHLGVITTARNYRTVAKLASLLSEAES